MYGLPKDFDGSPLIGRTLEMVCFNISQIYLHFEDHATITVESSLIYHGATGETLSPPVSETGIIQLVGHSLTKIEGKPNGTLSLTFDNGHNIECLDTSKDYESYRISFDGKTIIA